jgi:uncharacterized protein YndB with AHSA1/START domain
MTNLVVEDSVRIERPVARVFDAWSSGPALADWFAPMAVRPPIVEMLFEVGGPYRIEMDVGGGGVHITEGHFLEIVGEERIRMTWRCDAWLDPPSEVDVTFVPENASTVVRIRHTRITSGPACEGQSFGWQACLAQLRLTLVGLPKEDNE